MFLSILTTITLITTIGCAISFGSQPSTIGWSTSFVVSILVCSILPTIKYAQTLTLDHSDHIMLFVATGAHVAFFVLLSRYVSMDVYQSYLMWSTCACYPTILLLFIGLWTWRTNRYRINKLVVYALYVTFCVGVAEIAVAWWIWGTRVGAFMLAVFLLSIAFIVATIVWIRRGFYLSRRLTMIMTILCASLIAFGLALAVLVDDVQASFWSFTAAWIVLEMGLFVLGKGAKARIVGGDDVLHCK